MKRLDHKTIERYLDGELKPEEAKRVARALEKDPEAKRLANETSGLGHAVRASVQERMADRPSVDLWHAVEAGIRKEEKGRISERIRVWFQSRFPRTPWPVWGAVAAAIFAGVVLAIGLSVRSPADRTTKATVKPNNQIVFESIDYSGMPPTVFQIPDPDGQGSTTVIWVTTDDSDDDEEGGQEEQPPAGDSI